MSISNTQKSLLHVAKQKLAMADEDYRALLQRAAGVSSSVDLDDAGFTRVLAEFERLGFHASKGRPAAEAKRPGFATAKQIGKLRGLWQAYSGSDDEVRFNHWLEKHFHVSHTRFLEGYQAGKAIAVLQKMKQQVKAKRQANAGEEGAQ